MRNDNDFLYGHCNGEQVMIHNTPQQISAYIAANQDKGDMLITTPLDQPFLRVSYGGFIQKCASQGYLRNELLPVWSSAQMGLVDLEELLLISDASFADVSI